MLISIVIPIYNEEKNIPLLYREIIAVITPLVDYRFEIIFVDDGSSDRSWTIIKTIADHDPQVMGIQFSRNFGNQIATSAGYQEAAGDAIITIDGDLQHPPSLIADLIAAWHKGNDIVYVHNGRPPETLLKSYISKKYYQLFCSIADMPLLPDVSDFRLIDKKVATIIRSSKEKSRYLRGLIAWTGFSYTIIPAIFNQRAAGVPGYTWKKLFKLACDGVTNFSLFPLRLAAYIGFFVSVTGMGMFGFITIESWCFNAHYPLFKWLVTLMYIFLGILFILLWIIGEYIGRIYEELKGRPLYIVREQYRQLMVTQGEKRNESDGVSPYQS